VLNIAELRDDQLFSTDLEIQYQIDCYLAPRQPLGKGRHHEMPEATN